MGRFLAEEGVKIHAFIFTPNWNPNKMTVKNIGKFKLKNLKG